MRRSPDGVIVVIGRPAVDEEGRLRGRAALIALAAAEKGGAIELVGSVGDDSEGDAAALGLGRAGVGHAALLRDPAAATPRAEQAAGGPLPRLDARDVELGLNYLPECQVLIVADALEPDALAVAAASARYHGARLIVLTEAADEGRDGGAPALPADATLLAAPPEESGAFDLLVASYAQALATGAKPDAAWQDALQESGWEPG